MLSASRSVNCYLSAVLVFFICLDSLSSQSEVQNNISNPSEVSDSQYWEAVDLYKASNLKDALKEFKKLVEQEPEAYLAYHKIVDICIEEVTLSLDSAIEYFSRLSEETPTEPFYLYGLGLAHWRNHEAREAISCFQAAIRLKPDFAVAYLPMAESFKLLDNLSEGLDYVQSQIQSYPNNAAAWLGLATMRRQQWDWDEALVALDSALSLKPDFPDAYIQKISILFAIGKLQDGLDLSLARLEFARERDDRIYEAQFLGNVGAALLRMGNFPDALDYSMQATAIAYELGERRSQGKWLGNAGIAHMYMGDFPEALDYFNQALQIDRELKDKLAEAFEVGNIASVYAELGDYEKALEYYGMSLEISRASKNKRNEAIDLGNIGSVYAYKGDYEKALEYTKLALALDRELGLKADESSDLGNIAILYMELGDYTNALEYFYQASALAREIGDKSLIARWTLGVSSVYYLLKILPTAMQHSLEATEISREIGDKMLEAECLGTTGLILAESRELTKSLEFFRKGLDVASQLGVPRLQAIALSSIGNIYSETGQYDSALLALDRSLEINRQIGNRFSEAETLNSLGLLNTKLDRYREAINCHNNALEFGRQVSSEKIVWEAHYGLGLAYEKQGENSKALTHYKSAVGSLEDIRAKLVSEEQKVSYYSASRADVYEKVQDLLYSAWRKSGSDTLLLECFEYTERQKARALADLVAESKIDIREGVDSALVGREAEVMGEISLIYTSLRREGLTDDEIDGLSARLREQEDLLSQLRFQMRVASPGYTNLKYPEPLTISDVQEFLEGKDDVILEYSIGDEHSYLWAITGSNWAVFQIPPRAELERHLRPFRQLVSKPPTATKADLSAGEKLYELLVAPAQESLGDAQNLIIIPDGELNYLPFEALTAGNVKDDPAYLVELFTIHYSPSASVLKRLEERREEDRISQQRELVAFGNPHFGRSLAAMDKGDISERGLYEWRGFKLMPLPYAEEEVKGIGVLYPEKNVALYLGTDATEEAVKLENLSKFKRIHFATHAIIDEEFPSRSCVVLTLDEDPREDGFLRLNEIFNLKLNSELLVLSACQTALGKLVKGEGMLGLSRGFFYAGTEALLVTLWGVNDQSTAEFMESFYQRTTAGVSNAEALRETKLAFVKGDVASLRHPYYWAPFVLIGAN